MLAHTEYLKPRHRRVTAFRMNDIEPLERRDVDRGLPAERVDMLFDRVLVRPDRVDDIQTGRPGDVQVMMGRVDGHVVRRVDDVERLDDRAVARIHHIQFSGVARTDKQAPALRIEGHGRIPARAGNVPDGRQFARAQINHADFVFVAHVHEQAVRRMIDGHGFQLASGHVDPAYHRIVAKGNQTDVGMILM